MMGRLNHDQRELFYSFRLEEAVPDDHPVRRLLPFWTFLGCIQNWRHFIRRLGGLRLIRR
jgi:hypothetical protein